jgi:hypothetical protein
VLMYILILCTLIKNHAGLEKSEFIKRSFCLLLVSILTFLHMPLFDIIIRTMVATYYEINVLSILITRYSICGLTLILFSLFMVFLVRIFNVCVPTEMIPWCSPISKLVFLNLLIKAGLVLSNAFDINGGYALYEVLLFFGL